VLNVAVNVRPLMPGRIGGLEFAFRHTLDVLVGRPDVRCTLLTAFYNYDAFEALGSRVQRVRVDDPELPHGLQRAIAGHDVLWCPFLVLDPEQPPVPGVAMVPDLQHETWPGFFTRDELAFRLRRYRTTIAWSKRVLTLSEFCKQELVERYHVPDDHVVVVPLDCGPEFRTTRPDPGRQAALRSQYDLPERYLLFPATTHAHKNHRGALRALFHYRQEFGAPPALVLTGADTGAVDLRQEIETLRLGPHVRRLGQLPGSDLPHLYDGASALLFCSLFEGFGIPVVEAFRRGTPVIASNTTSIPEVAGDGARLVDPTDPAAIARAVHATLHDVEATQALVARGRQRAERFSYALAAERTLEALRAAAREPAPVVAAVRSGALPKVFVVTPSFHQGRFLRATIESVLRQDYPNLDYFVADGGSTDDSVAILQSYGARVRWVSGPDGGQAAAIAGAWRSTGAEIVAWLNSDDTWLPGAVRTAVDWLLRHPEHAMVYGNACYTDADGRETGPYPTRPFDRDRLRGECFICQPAAFVRREVFRVIDLPDPALRYCMDYDLWIRLSERFAVGHLDRYLATSRMHAQNKTLGERDAVYREILRVVRRHFEGVPRSWTIGFAWHRGLRLLERLFACLPVGMRTHIHAWVMRRRRQRIPGPPFPDGWAGARTIVEALPDADGRVVVHGESPCWPYRTPLVIRVESDRRRLGRHVVRARGPFRIEVVVGERRLQPVALVLTANRTFVPLRHRLGQDPRALAFRLAPPAAGGEPR
jgi:glycosyltransferase involved in cell wall biosynthesis